MAAVSYTDPGGNPAVVQSNQVDTTTAAIRTPATLTFNRVTSTGSGVSTGPTSCAQGGMAFELLPNPLLLGGTPVDPDQPSTLTQTNLYHEGEPLFVTLSDPDQNVDSGIRDTVDVTIDALPGGDSETLRLTETDVNSGLFAGYVQSTGGSASPGDCRLQVSNDGNVSGSYQDPDDATDMAQSTAIVDPINIVFDATTGTPVNGAEVRLVDAATGAPAVVFGLDGVSAFPATITTGANVVDGSGRTYVFPNGGYRFPVVPPGNYRIEITAPSGYIDLSTASIDQLQTLPGAPYALDTGSFGTSFAVADTLAFNLDVPLDPEASILYLQKTSGNSVASPGDFVQYSLRIENTGALVQTEVTIADLLPVGFRLMPGSTYIDEAAAPDPLAALDGRTLTFAVGDLQPGESVGVRYVTEVTVGATGETAVNLARASSTTGAESNEASATLQLVDDLFTSEAIIVGRTIMGSCDDSVANDFDGVSGLRIYMDDGRYAITDDGGRFHFEGVKPGTHVVQLDLDTVPEHLEVFDCRTNSRFAGKTFSRFVDLRAGSLWRTDFHLREKPLPTGSVALELAGERAGSDSILYTLNLDGGGLPVDDLVVSVILPEGLAYLPGSSVINDARHDDPEVRGGTLSFRLGGKPAEWNEQLSLHAHVTDEAGGEITARAVASYRMVNGESGRTPVAEDQFEYRPERFDIRTASVSPRFRNLSTYLTRDERDDINSIVAGWDGGGDAVLIATGHTDSNPIAPGHHLFADNYELSLARATAVQRYVAGHLGIPEERIRIQGRGPDEPVADNATDAG
ncbi:MAG: OmpA family protein, partial [Gammaproteobacteria bacterium]